MWLFLSALILSVSLPSLYSPPNVWESSTDWLFSSHASVRKILNQIFGFLISAFSFFFISSITFVFQSYDALRIHTTTESELIDFIVRYADKFFGAIDGPQNLIFVGIHFFYFALIVGIRLVYNTAVSAVSTVIGLVLYIGINITANRSIGDAIKVQDTNLPVCNDDHDNNLSGRTFPINASEGQSWFKKNNFLYFGYRIFMFNSLYFCFWNTAWICCFILYFLVFFLCFTLFRTHFYCYYICSPLYYILRE